MTTEEAKVIYECLNQNQIVSPIHFNIELPRLYSIKETAYNRLEELLEKEGPLNPYEYMLMNPQSKLPTNDPELEDFYDMSNIGSQEVNTQHMEDWSILSTELHYTHQKSTENENLLVLEGQDKITTEWIASGKSPCIRSNKSPKHPNCKRLFGSI